MDDVKTKKFNKFQELFFPIYGYELKKFIPMSLLMFMIVFIYGLVRSLKDYFIHYNTNLWIGAKPEETAVLISALKLWFVLPCAFLMVMAFTALLNKFGSTKAFYITISAFMLFYLIYGYVVYPNLNLFVVSEEQITKITSSVPIFFRAFLTCLANWPLTLFYIISELWGTTAISFLFWQFANKVTMSHEVKRFFGLFSLLSNLGSILSGSIIKNCSSNYNVGNIRLLMTLVVMSGLVILGIYTYINKIVLKDPLLYDKSKLAPKKHKKEKVSSIEGIKILFKNPYLMLIVILVLSYGICINFSEVIMNSCMKEAFTGSQYASMQGNLLICTGVFSGVVVILSNNILRKFSWKIAAIITPICFLIAGGGFLTLVLYKQFISPVIFGAPAIFIIVWCGIISDSLFKSFKYSLFDSTKSMAYLPLDPDERNKGQAAVEIIGGRAGKAGASAIQQVMTAFPRTLQTTTGVVSGLLAYTPAIVLLFFATVISWIFSVLKLSTRYENKIKENNSRQ